MGKYNGFNTGGGNMQQLMRQAQKMQQEVARVQEEVGNTEFESSVGGGVVITIAPEVIDPDDIEMLQDLILSAVNEALRMAEDAMEKEMNKVTGGMGGLGGLGGFGF